MLESYLTKLKESKKKKKKHSLLDYVEMTLSLQKAS